MEISSEEFHTYVENSEGYCTNCDEVTRSETEPDAEDYDCPNCGNHTVMGMENAMISGFVTITDE